MPLSRPMTSIAVGAEELRILDRAGIDRNLVGACWFFVHEKSRTTPKRELEMVKKRLKELLHEKD